MFLFVVVFTIFFFGFWYTVTPTIVGTVMPEGPKHKICFVNFKDSRQFIEDDTNLKLIYYVTPTYPRPEQIPELIRLSHTLMHVPRIHWIVADDQNICSEEVARVLKKTGLPYTHVSSPKPTIKLTRGTNFPRGVANRRAALVWLRDNVREGILYFGDDDNTVDLQLFSEIRNTKKVSMFPVGLIGSFGVSSPVVQQGKVIGFFDSWPASRKFPVDMAGFAVNIDFLKPTTSMPFVAGHEEDRFLISTGLNVEDIEPLADNCSKILVWHTRTSKYKKPRVKINIPKLEKVEIYESFSKLLKVTTSLGMATFDPTNGLEPYITNNRKTVAGLT